MNTDETPTNTPATGSEPAPEAPAAPAAPPAAPEPAPAAPNVVSAEVDVLAPDFQHEKIGTIEAALANGQKFTVSKDEFDQIIAAHPKAAALFTNLRRVATLGREAVVSGEKALNADRTKLASEKAETAREREENRRLHAVLTDPKLLAALKVEPPPGGEPDPLSPRKDAQEYWARKHVASALEEMLKPLREKSAEFIQQDAAQAEEARKVAVRDQVQAFIDKTSDFNAYQDDIRGLLERQEVATVEAGYHVAKARRVAAPAAAPKAVERDPSKMTVNEITEYAIANPEWAARYAKRKHALDG